VCARARAGLTPCGPAAPDAGAKETISRDTNWLRNATHRGATGTILLFELGRAGWAALRGDWCTDDGSIG